jgi:hypothetical protein
MRCNRIIPILAALALLGIGAAPAGAVDVESILKERSRADLLPASDSAILYHGTTITIQNDGRMEREEHIIRYLRTDNAWDDYGDPHIAWDTDRQELEILVSRVHTEDGRKIDTTPNGFNPMVPFGLDLAPDFTHIHQMVVTHLGIETRAVTELKYRIRDTKPLYPWAWGEVIFGGEEPVLHREVTVQAGMGVGLTVKEENGAPKPLRRLDERNDVYTWNMNDLPGYRISDPGAEPEADLPRVSFTTCRDWKALSRESGRRFDEAAAQRAELHADLKPIAELNSAEQKLDSLVAFAKNRVAVKSFDNEALKFAFRTADRIYRTGYGGPADLAVLYASALQTLDFRPEVHLLISNPLAVPGFTGREQYVIHLRLDRSDIWLYPMDHRLTYRAPDRITLIGISPAGEPQVMPVMAADQNRIQLDLGITLQENQSAERSSAEGWVYLKTTGALAQYDAVRTDGAKEWLAGWLQDLSADLELTDPRLTVMEPARVEARSVLKLAVEMDSTHRLVKLVLPWKISRLEDLLPAGLALNYPGRDLPLHLEEAGSFVLNLQIQYPENWIPALLPGSKQDAAPGVTYRDDAVSGNGSFKLSRSVTFSDAVVAVEHWNAWRAVILSVDEKTRNTLLFQLPHNGERAEK